MSLYGANEAQSITDYLLEGLLGLTGSDRLNRKPLVLSSAQKKSIETAIVRLNDEEPIQHVVGYGWFYGRQFEVNRDVLIPRPETEELVHWIVSSHKLKAQPRLVDIGTGTGCIPITIALEAPDFQCEGWDISEPALEIAHKNARQLGAEVSFRQIDILQDSVEEMSFDIIVSNPPYVRLSEKALMSRNVLEFDPHLALFVTDEDPLIFYRRIATLALTGLQKGGWLYFEINEAFGTQMTQLLESIGYVQVELRQDLNGKDRMIRGKRS
jgi:release factor glutamine methyltransferase